MIRLIDIYKTYDNGTKALKGINLRIDDGEFAFLVGSSGSVSYTHLSGHSGRQWPYAGPFQVRRQASQGRQDRRKEVIFLRQPTPATLK